MSLRFKMVVGIGAILAVVIAEYAVVSIQAQRRHALAVVRLEADLISRIAYRAISIAMEQGKSDEVQQLLERMHGQQAALDIRIVDPDGRVLRSSDPDEVGRAVAGAQRPPTATSLDPMWTVGGDAVGVFRRIPSSQPCWSCHDSALETLGVLSVHVRPGADDPQIAHQLEVLVGSGAIALVAAGVLMVLLFTFLVSRRIDALALAMGQVQAGDLAVRAPEQSRDELGRLGKSFNVMAAKLARERARLEAARAEEIRQAGQLAALEKMAAVGRITAGIAHEVNNPLNNITLTVEGIVDDLDALDRPALREMIHDIGAEANRAGEIVRDLLNYIRHEPFELVPVALASVVETAFQRVERELGAERIRFECALPPDLPAVRGSVNQLGQVFFNLFKNAVQAMPEGGALRVTARCPPPGGEVQVEVSDQGHGIPADRLPHIFEPFFTTKEPGQGTGLGLWVAYGIVQKHGGEIRVTSTVDVGTTLHIALPAAVLAGTPLP